MLTLCPRVFADIVDVGGADEQAVLIPAGHYDLVDGASLGVGEAAAEEHPPRDGHRGHLGPRVGADLLIGHRWFCYLYSRSLII